MKRVAIIGGGPAGLCAAKHFIHNKHDGGVQFEPVIFEQQEEVGGTWVYRDINKSNTDPVQGFSSIYKNLITNLPKQTMCYPDYPFPEDAPTFPHHTAVLKYIQDYAKHFDLYKYVRFNTKVTSVEPIKQMKTNLDENEARFIQWKVTTQDVCTLKDSSNVYDAVIVCSGHYSTPCMPDIKGIESFPGEIFHSHYYRDPEIYRGKIAVVFGNGPSGTDMMSELSDVCPMVYFCHRGGAEKSRTKHKPNVVELPSISQILPSGEIVFENKVTVRADVIIVCTGYLYDYSFLSKECEVTLAHGNRVVMPTYKHLFHTKYPSLAFIGLQWSVAPMPVMHQQCAYLTSVLSGNNILPDENDMNKETRQEFQNNVANGEPERYFHKMGSKQFEYNNELAMLSGISPNPKVMETLYCHSWNMRNQDSYNFKKKEYKVLNDNDFICL